MMADSPSPAGGGEYVDAFPEPGQEYEEDGDDMGHVEIPTELDPVEASAASTVLGKLFEKLSLLSLLKVDASVQVCVRVRLRLRHDAMRRERKDDAPHPSPVSHAQRARMKLSWPVDFSSPRRFTNKFRIWGTSFGGKSVGEGRNFSPSPPNTLTPHHLRARIPTLSLPGLYVWKHTRDKPNAS